MIKLQKIITEALNTFSVEMAMKSNRKYGLIKSKMGNKNKPKRRFKTI